MLVISEDEIRAHGPGRILAVWWQQWRIERHLARRGVHFRTTALAEVEASYATMSETEFDAINGPQEWANWRTIPRALNAHVPSEPLRVLDLGCGTGYGTADLARVASTAVGVDLAPEAIDYAERHFPSARFLQCARSRRVSSPS